MKTEEARMPFHFDRMSPFERGVACWRQGGVRADCSFVTGSREHQEWLDGYNAAAGVAPPYPWCPGNPTVADCIKAGTCRRNPNCGE